MNQRVFRFLERVFRLALWFSILIFSTELFAYPVEFADEHELPFASSGQHLEDAEGDYGGKDSLQ